MSDDPVLCWEDILWSKNLIFVRHEVAKQTRARDRRRYIPLEPAAGKILGPLAGTGPIMAISVGYLHKLRRKLAGLMKIKLPENCFRIPSHGFSSPNCFGRLGNQRLACDLRIVAEERIPQEAAWEDPKLNFRSLLGRFVQIPANGFTDQTVSIEQTIPLSGKNRSRERAAAAEAVAAFQDLRRQELEVIFKTRFAFLQLSNDNELLELNQTEGTALSQTVESSRTKFEVGAEPESDLLTAQIERQKVAEERQDLEQKIAHRFS